MSELKEKTAKGLLWGGFSNALQQLLNLLFGIFLARLLTPADYGMVGMLTIFNAIACALQEGGFIAALTNQKNATHADYNAVFWFNVGVSLSLYLLLFLSAPLIARFYSVPALTPLARVCFLSFVISSLNIVPRAILFSRLKVKESTLATLGSLAISALSASLWLTTLCLLGYCNADTDLRQHDDPAERLAGPLAPYLAHELYTRTTDDWFQQ